MKGYQLYIQKTDQGITWDSPISFHKTLKEAQGAAAQGIIWHKEKHVWRGGPWSISKDEFIYHLEISQSSSSGFHQAWENWGYFSMLERATAFAQDFCKDTQYPERGMITWQTRREIAIENGFRAYEYLGQTPLPTVGPAFMTRVRIIEYQVRS